MTSCTRIASWATTSRSSIRWGTTGRPIPCWRWASRVFPRPISTGRSGRAVLRAARRVTPRIARQLQTTYCGTLGVEYMDIASRDQRTWLQERIEPALNRPSLPARQSRRTLELLVTAQTFEEFLHAKFLGQKRFSLEGAESLIPLLDTLIEEGAALGAEEVVMGMAHRGRLNVLANVVAKALRDHPRRVHQDGRRRRLARRGRRRQIPPRLFPQSRHGPADARSTARSAPIPAIWNWSTR